MDNKNIGVQTLQPCHGFGVGVIVRPVHIPIPSGQCSLDSSSVIKFALQGLILLLVQKVVVQSPQNLTQQGPGAMFLESPAEVAQRQPTGGLIANTDPHHIHASLDQGRTGGAVLDIGPAEDGYPVFLGIAQCFNVSTLESEHRPERIVDLLDGVLDFPDGQFPSEAPVLREPTYLIKRGAGLGTNAPQADQRVEFPGRQFGFRGEQKADASGLGRELRLEIHLTARDRGGRDRGLKQIFQDLEAALPLFKHLLISEIIEDMWVGVCMRSDDVASCMEVLDLPC